MIPLSREQLGRPAEETIRLIARHHLDSAAEALSEVGDPTRPEALHDFRVALRRLRSMERSYRPWLAGSFPKRIRRRIGDLARSTGSARDAEVQLAWLDSVTVERSERDEAGLEYVRQQIRPRMARSYATIADAAGTAFPGLHRELTAHLSSSDVTVPLDLPGVPATILSVSATPIEDGVERLRELLGGVASATDTETLHAARIAGKRLRYLLEPLQAAHESLPEVVSSLKGLQDLLGSLHDLQTMASLLAGALESAAAEWARCLHAAALETGATPEDPESPDATAGILSLTAALRSQRDRLFEHFEASWLHGAADPFLRRLRDIARRFRAHPPAVRLHGGRGVG